MRNMEEVRDLVSRAKYYYDNGDGMTGNVYGKIVLTGVLIGTFISYLDAMGVSAWLVCLAGIGIVVFGNMFLGYLNNRYGILRHYNNMGWYSCDVAMGLVKTNEEIHKKITKKYSIRQAASGKWGALSR